MTQHQRLFLASVIWSAAWTLMVADTFVETSLPLAGWGIFIALGACVLTGWWIVEHVVQRERFELERLAEIMACEMARQNDLPRIPTQR